MSYPTKNDKMSLETKKQTKPNKEVQNMDTIAEIIRKILGIDLL